MEAQQFLWHLASISKTVLTGLVCVCGGGVSLCWKTKSSSLLHYIMKLFLALPQHTWLVQTVNGLWLHIFTSQTASICNQKEPCHPYKAWVSICLCFCSQADRVSLNYIKHWTNLNIWLPFSYHKFSSINKNVKEKT